MALFGNKDAKIMQTADSMELHRARLEQPSMSSASDTSSSGVSVSSSVPERKKGSKRLLKGLAKHLRRSFEAQTDALAMAGGYLGMPGATMHRDWARAEMQQRNGVYVVA